ncbi:MAG TPA: hypothetical protein VFQ35_11280 [Polyangiaceae bacterium]|nr:hypothetical protein [Polyangiaceae bacterium]
MDTTRIWNAAGTRSVAAIAALLVTPLLALMFGGNAQSQPAEPAPAHSAPPSPAPAAEPLEYCAGRLFEPLASISGSEVVTGGAGFQAGLEATLADVRKTFPGPIQTLIATIADPIDAGLGYQFDTSLSALRLGVESHVASSRAHYFRDRAFIPWDDRSAPPDKRKESEACRYTTPGLVVFRGSDASHPELFALLLVGETPTTGVHERALHRAVQIARAFDPRAGTDTSTPLNVIGPTFSGSAHSLRLAFSQAEGLRHVRVITGSASGSALKKTLTGATAGPKLSFLSTTAPESAVLCSYLRFLYYFLGFQSGSLEPFTGVPRAIPGVALLHESGTEFGTGHDDTRSGGCRLRPEVDIAFPVHVSRLRDAYEEMDTQQKSGTSTERLARATTLDISLRERNLPLTLGAEPSPKTTFAEDVALSNVLTAIAREGVRHVGIQATDVADAIFLARKIRDVSPDVRLAFFASDVLLLHPAFRRDLGGSLVVSPYPFLGSTDFAQVGAPETHSHFGFENSASEGIFNATLAARGATVPELRDFRFTDIEALSLWVSAIGPNGLVPIALGMTDDPDGTIFPGTEKPRKPGAQDEQTWRKLARAELRLAQNPHIPRLFQFAYVLLWLAFCIDQVMQRRTLETFSWLPVPGRMGRREDRQADLAIVRTKWSLYAAIRTFVLAFGIGYMTLVYALPSALRRHGGERVVLALLSLLALGAVYRALVKAWAFGSDYVALGRCVGGFSPLTWVSLRFRPRASQVPPESIRGTPLSDEQSQDSALEGEKPVSSLGWDRWSAPLGFARPEGRVPAAQTSFAQLRLLANLALAVALAFSAGEVVEFFGRALTVFEQGHPVQGTTLLTLRSLPLLNTVSPAAPTLICVAIVYIWAVGRMARIRVAHGLSRISPDDGVADVATTPIRVVLYPYHGEGQRADESFTRIERRAINAVIRPITGPNYCVALLIIIFIPVVLFTLKPLSTLERPLSTALLVSGLGLCTVLVGNTLLQLVQHWFSLELMLKRILQHPLGRSFDRVAGFVRDSTDHQVSRSPHDLLRLGGCAVRFDELVRAGKRLDASGFALERRKRLESLALTVHSMRTIALSAATHTDLRDASNHEANLGREIIRAASEVMKLLCDAWEGRILRTPPAFRGKAVERTRAPEEDDASEPAESGPIDSTDDALSAEAHRYSKLERAWLREAEGFVATVVALLINRHVRQFQYFLYTMTSSALLLLLAIVSYPFQPQRLLLTWIWVVVGSVVLAGLFVYIELDRNALLSRIAGTTPGHLTLNGSLLFRVLGWGIVPLLGVAAAQYPDFANTLFHWLEPFTRALR